MNGPRHLPRFNSSTVWRLDGRQLLGTDHQIIPSEDAVWFRLLEGRNWEVLNLVHAKTGHLE